MSAEITRVELARNWVAHSGRPERYRCDWRADGGGRTLTGTVYGDLPVATAAEGAAAASKAVDQLNRRGDYRTAEAFIAGAHAAEDLAQATS